jgi:hypothetical protein
MSIDAIKYKWIEGSPGSTYTGTGWYVQFPDGFAFRYTIDKKKKRDLFRAKPNEKFDMLDPDTYEEVTLTSAQLRDILITLFTQVEDFDTQP